MEPRAQNAACRSQKKISYPFTHNLLRVPFQSPQHGCRQLIEAGGVRGALFRLLYELIEGGLLLGARPLVPAAGLLPQRHKYQGYQVLTASSQIPDDAEI